MAYERRRLLHLQALSLGRMQASDAATAAAADGMSPRPSARGAAAGTAQASASSAVTPGPRSSAATASSESAPTIASATGVALSPREWR